MSKISDTVAELESQIEAMTAERDALKRQVERQKGAIEEGRGIIHSLQKQVGELGKLCGVYEQHFHTLHGSAKHLSDQEKALAEARAEPIVELDQEPPSRLMDRLGLVKRRSDKAIAAATNGHAQ